MLIIRAFRAAAYFDAVLARGDAVTLELLLSAPQT